MRTTVNLSENALKTAKHYAQVRNVSLSDAVSDLIEKSVLHPPQLRSVGHLLLVAKQGGRQKISPEAIAKLLHEG